MSNKNRLQRRGINIVADDAVLGGAIGELAGAVGYRTPHTGTAQLEYMYTRMLTRIAMSRFTWKGLPDSVSRRWLETCLFTQALSVFFIDPDTGKYFATQGSPAGNFNMVGDPTEFRAVSANNFRWWLLNAAPEAKECVPIWANELRTPDIDIVRIFAHTLAETDRTIQINLLNARQPKFLAYDESRALTVQNINRQINEGASQIAVTKEIGESMEDIFQVLDMSIHPDLLLNTSIMRTRIWGECMTMLGINNAPNQDKKERVVAAEVSGNDDVIETIRETNLESRQVACDQINDMFGLNISVEYATDMNQTAMKDVGQDQIAGPGQEEQ